MVISALKLDNLCHRPVLLFNIICNSKLNIFYFQIVDGEEWTSWQSSDDPAGWNWSWEWQEKTDETEFWPRSPTTLILTFCDASPVHCKPDTLILNHPVSPCINCSEIFQQIMWSRDFSWWHRLSQDGCRSWDSVLDIWTTEMGVWYQPQHHLCRGKISSDD